MYALHIKNIQTDVIYLWNPLFIPRASDASERTATDRCFLFFVCLRVVTRALGNWSQVYTAPATRIFINLSANVFTITIINYASLRRTAGRTYLAWPYITHTMCVCVYTHCVGPIRQQQQKHPRQTMPRHQRDNAQVHYR